MTVHDLKQHFGTYLKAAEAIGVHRITIHSWRNGIPKDKQALIFYLTRGELVPDFPPNLP